MTDAVRTLLWWNRDDDAEALFWHEAARGARIVTVEEFGAACRIDVALPVSAMASLLPPEISFIERATPDAVAAALRRVLGGARSLRVLVAGASATPALLDACVAVFAPDVVAQAGRVAPDGEAAHRAALARWRRGFDGAARGRRFTTRRYPVADLLTRGPPPRRVPDPSRPLELFPARFGARLLLPGCGGGATRVVLHIPACARPDAGDWDADDWDAGDWDVRLDGRTVAARSSPGQVELVAVLGDAACHRLDISYGGDPGVGVAAVTVGPA